MLTKYVDLLRYMMTGCSDSIRSYVLEVLYSNGYQRDVVIYWEEVPEKMAKRLYCRLSKQYEKELEEAYKEIDESLEVKK